MGKRQLVAAAFVVLGGVLLGLSLRIEPGGWFYAASLGLSAVWVVGALAVGPPRIGPPRPVLLPIAVAAGLLALFAVGGLVLREVPFLADRAADVAQQAAQSAWPVLILVTLVTGVSEELFFRGALYDAVPRHQVAVTTVAYAVSTLAAGNVMLTFAAVVLGLVTGLERKRFDGLVAPILTHCCWSVSMLFVLPALFDR